MVGSTSPGQPLIGSMRPVPAYARRPDPLRPDLDFEEELAADEPKGMDEDDLQSFIKSEITSAEDVAAVLMTARTAATEYYKGDPFGDEEDGRSQVVSRDVHDTVHAILPSLVRIFFGPEHVAEFMPRGPEDVAQAEQATDYVDFVLKNDNPGFMILYSAFKDALIRSCGVFKYWWDETEEMISETYEGLDVEAAAMVISDAREIQGEAQVTERGDGLLDVEIRRLEHKGKIRVAAIPPEEYLINQTARDIDSARFVAHRCYKTAGELVAMGYKQDEVEEEAGAGDYDLINQEASKRLPNSSLFPDESSDPASRPVLYVEAYVKVDFDGDGIAELRQVCTLGSGYKVKMNRPVTERPFADLCPDPEPHTVFGNSSADQTMDIQRTKSSILRKMLDSLASAITPRTGVVEGQVNIEDVLNNETGAIIRMRAPGMVQPFNLPYIGQEAHPMLDYYDRVKESRTGISKAAAGLDADALQSTTRAAVAATVNAAHQHIEMIARIFAETGVKRLMKGIRNLAIRHQDKPRMVRLRNKWVAVSPASWNADADVTVNLAVGSTSMDERRASLEAIAQRQEAILQQYGPANPLVTVAQYRGTLAKIIELAGFRDPSQFFQEIPADFKPPDPKAQETPEQITAKMLAEVQVQQIKADIAMKQAELGLKREEMLLKNDRERDKNEAEIMLKARELELKYKSVVDIAGIQANTERERMNTPDPNPQPQQEVTQ